MLRAAAASISLSLVLAPFQCAHKPDPDLRREDTAGDALWALSENFRTQHNGEAQRATLAFLVEKYPSSRYAPAAKEELSHLGPAVRAEASSPDASAASP